MIDADPEARIAELEARVKRLEAETLWRNPHLQPPYDLPKQSGGFGIGPRFGDPIPPNDLLPRRQVFP